MHFLFEPYINRKKIKKMFSEIFFYVVLKLFVIILVSSFRNITRFIDRKSSSRTTRSTARGQKLSHFGLIFYNNNDRGKDRWPAFF